MYNYILIGTIACWLVAAAIFCTSWYYEKKIRRLTNAVEVYRQRAHQAEANLNRYMSWVD